MGPIITVLLHTHSAAIDSKCCYRLTALLRTHSAATYPQCCYILTVLLHSKQQYNPQTKPMQSSLGLSWSTLCNCCCYQGHTPNFKLKLPLHTGSTTASSNAAHRQNLRNCHQGLRQARAVGKGPGVEEPVHRQETDSLRLQQPSNDAKCLQPAGPGIGSQGRNGGIWYWVGWLQLLHPPAKHLQCKFLLQLAHTTQICTLHWK